MDLKIVSNPPEPLIQQAKQAEKYPVLFKVACFGTFYANMEVRADQLIRYLNWDPDEFVVLTNSGSDSGEEQRFRLHDRLPLLGEQPAFKVARRSDLILDRLDTLIEKMDE